MSLIGVISILIIAAFSKLVTSDDYCQNYWEIPPNSTKIFYNSGYPEGSRIGSICNYLMYSIEGYKIQLNCTAVEMMKGEKGCINFLAVRLNAWTHKFCDNFSVSGKSIQMTFVSNVWGTEGKYKCAVTSFIGDWPYQRDTCFCGQYQADDKSDNASKTLDFPITAVLYNFRANEITCNAAIISRSILLSIASCFSEDPDTSNYGVITGNFSTFDRKDVDAENVYYIERIIIEKKNYERDEQDQTDIVLIMTNRLIDLSKNVSIACLPYNLPNKKFDGMISAWAIKDINGIKVKIFKHVKVKTFLKSICRTIWGKSFIDEAHTCIVPLQNTRDCLIGAGSPLYILRDGRFYLIGLALPKIFCLGAKPKMLCIGAKPSFVLNLKPFLPMITRDAAYEQFCQIPSKKEDLMDLDNSSDYYS